MDQSRAIWQPNPPGAQHGSPEMDHTNTHRHRDLRQQHQYKYSEHTHMHRSGASKVDNVGELAVAKSFMKERSTWICGPVSSVSQTPIGL